MTIHKEKESHLNIVDINLRVYLPLRFSLSIKENACHLYTLRLRATLQFPDIERILFTLSTELHTHTRGTRQSSMFRHKFSITHKNSICNEYHGTLAKSKQEQKRTSTRSTPG